jgi:glycosyltransferase involved in cell wall biosynthesis
MTDTFTRYLLAAGGVSVVVPVYKSASSLPLLHDRLNAVLTPLPCAWEIVFVNDASPDICDTVLDSLRLSHPHLTVITLAANCGQHRAIFHGICQARYPVIITLDDDLQTPPEEIPKFLTKLSQGYEVVIGRPPLKAQAPWRNFGSRLHQSLVAHILEKPKDLSLSSYRGLGPKAVAAIRRHTGVAVYLPALLLRAAPRNQITNIDIEHHSRTHGSSSYSLGKLFSLASRLLIDHSVIPLRFTVAWGLLLSLLSIGFAAYLCLRYALGQHTIPGWTSLMVAVSFLFGNLFIAIGILGEYIGRLVREVSSAQGYEVFSIEASPNPSPLTSSDLIHGNPSSPS